MKKIIIAVFILIFAFVLFHAGLWILKTRILTNNIQEIVKKEANFVSVGSVDVSFLPLSQKITVTNILIKSDGGEIYSKNIEIYPNALSTAYSVKLPDAVFIKDQQAQEINHKIEFSADSQFTVSLSKKVNNFLLKYSGSGYKIINNLKQKTSFEVQVQEGQVEIDFGDDFTYRSKSSSLKVIDEDGNVLLNEGPSNIEFSVAKVGDVKNVKFNIGIKDLEFFLPKKSQDNGASASLMMPISDDFNSGKLDLTLVGLVATKENQNAAAAPNQMMLDSYLIDLQNFELLHQQYKIFLNGKVEGSLQNYPASRVALNLQVEGLDNIVNLIILNRLEKIYATAPEPSLELQNLKEKIMLYVEALKKLATKNSKTTTTRLAFDIKKDALEPEVKINETTFQEFLMQLTDAAMNKEIEGDANKYEAAPNQNIFGAQ